MEAHYSFIPNLACNGPTSDANGHPVGAIPLNGNFPRSQLGNELNAYFNHAFISVNIILKLPISIKRRKESLHVTIVDIVLYTL